MRKKNFLHFGPVIFTLLGIVGFKPSALGQG